MKEDALMAALTGVAGAAFAASIVSFHQVSGILAIHYIVKEQPTTAIIPERPNCPCSIDVRTTGACGEGHFNQHPGVPTPDGRGVAGGVLCGTRQTRASNRLCEPSLHCGRLITRTYCKPRISGSRKENERRT